MLMPPLLELILLSTNKGRMVAPFLAHCLLSLWERGFCLGLLLYLTDNFQSPLTWNFWTLI